MAEDEMCRIPVKARYEVINGNPVMVSAEWRDIPASAIAAFLIEKFGKDAIFKGDEKTC